MLLAMACFAIEDALIKASTASLPTGQVMMAFGAGGTFLFAAALIFQGKPLFRRDHFTRGMAIRAMFEACGRVFFVLSVALGALSTATVILQATPIVVVAAAWAFLGDRPTGGRWIALVLGAIGVGVVLAPSITAVSWATLLALIGMFGFAGRDLMSRTAPSSLGTAHLGLWGFITLIVSGGAYMAWEGRWLVPLKMDDLVLLGPAVCLGVIAYAALMKAMRTGDVSAVAPFRYFRLVFGVLLGVALFGEQLTLQTIVGAAIIVASGLLLLADPQALLQGLSRRLRAKP